MSGSSEIYWDEDEHIPGFGDMWFLKIPQLTGHVGGGDMLLGSILPRADGSLFKHYPMPRDFMEPQYILKQLQYLRYPLKIDGPIPETQTWAAGLEFSQTNANRLLVDSKKITIPSVPIILGFSLDYSKISSVKISLGSDVIGSYINKDYLVRLYKYYKGDSRKISPGTNIASQYICDAVLTTESYSVTVTSSEDFNASVTTGLSNLPDTPEVKITVKDETSRSFVLNIERKDRRAYMVALGVERWDNLG